MSSTTNRSTERGQVLLLFAGGLVALLTIAALVFDVGMMLLERRDEQNAADAAALAGARYVLVDTVQAEAAARNIALVNGFDDADPSEVVNIFIPPIHGQYAGLPGFIEVQIEGTRPSIFGGIVGRASWPVGAYAVATNAQDLTFPFSMLALDQTACKSIQVSGGGVVEAYANIQSNSSGADCTGAPIGFSRTGTSTIDVYADSATCRVVGELQDQGSGSMTCTPAENSFALPDPLRNLEAPAKPGLAPAMTPIGHATTPFRHCPGGSPAPSEVSPTKCKIPATGGPSNQAWILYPGLYPGGIEVSQGRTVYLMPGIYWIGGGGLDVGGGGSIVTIGDVSDAMADVTTAPCAQAMTTAALCGGVMIYNSALPNSTGGPVVLNSSGAFLKLAALDAPTSDPTAIYNGIVLFQDRTVTATVTLNGASSSAIVEGIVYVPEAEVKLNGNGGTLVLDQVIANTFLIDGGGGTIKILHGTGVDAVIVAAGLVE